MRGACRLGGQGSSGPEEEADTVPSAADIGQDQARKVSELEACLFWGGETRLRVQVLLDVGLGEAASLIIYKSAGSFVWKDVVDLHSTRPH